MRHILLLCTMSLLAGNGRGISYCSFHSLQKVCWSLSRKPKHMEVYCVGRQCAPCLVFDPWEPKKILTWSLLSQLVAILTTFLIVLVCAIVKTPSPTLAVSFNYHLLQSSHKNVRTTPKCWNEAYEQYNTQVFNLLHRAVCASCAYARSACTDLQEGPYNSTAVLKSPESRQQERWATRSHQKHSAKT